VAERLCGGEDYYIIRVMLSLMPKRFYVRARSGAAAVSSAICALTVVFETGGEAHLMMARGYRRVGRMRIARWRTALAQDLNRPRDLLSLSTHH